MQHVPDAVGGAAANARAHAHARHEEARRLEAELGRLNAELGETRTRQEHLQRPSTFVTETGRYRLSNWVERIRARLDRR